MINKKGFAKTKTLACQMPKKLKEMNSHISYRKKD